MFITLANYWQLSLIFANITPPLFGRDNAKSFHLFTFVLISCILHFCQGDDNVYIQKTMSNEEWSKISHVSLKASSWETCAIHFRKRGSMGFFHFDHQEDICSFFWTNSFWDQFGGLVLAKNPTQV